MIDKPIPRPQKQDCCLWCGSKEWRLTDRISQRIDRHAPLSWCTPDWIEAAGADPFMTAECDDCATVLNAFQLVCDTHLRRIERGKET